MAEHYDVIIVGTGAGGGTLAHTLAGSGKNILLWSAGTSARRWTTGIRGRCSSTEVHPPRTPVRPRRPAVPAPGPLPWAGDRCAGAALYRLRPDFGESARRRIPGLAAVVRRLRAVVHPGRAAVSGDGNGGETDRGSPVGALSVVGGVPRGQDPADVDALTKGGWQPFHAPAASAERADRPAAPVSAAPGATVTLSGACGSDAE
jgi:hypothetical protein